MRPSSENKLTIPRLLLIAAILVSWLFSSFRRHDDGSCIKETKDVVDTSENGDGRKGRDEGKRGEISKRRRIPVFSSFSRPVLADMSGIGCNRQDML
jgi:hypothetical protein